MKFLLAAYDPAHETADGSYWVWGHNDIPADVRNSFYYEVAAKNLPRNPNELLPDDCHGGWAAVSDTWACWYRFLNGGRDLRGRPGRFVLICAFCRRRDYANHNGFPVLNAGPFQDLSKVAVFSRPLPAPDRLDLDLDLPEIAVMTTSPFANGPTNTREYRGAEATARAASVCANLRPEDRFHCAVCRHDGEWAITVEMTAASDKPVARISPTLPASPIAGAVVHRVDSHAGPKMIQDHHRRHSVLRLLSISVPMWAALAFVCLAGAIGFLAGHRVTETPPVPPSASPPSSAPAAFTQDDVRPPVGADGHAATQVPVTETAGRARTERPKPKADGR